MPDLFHRPVAIVCWAVLIIISARHLSGEADNLLKNLPQSRQWTQGAEKLLSESTSERNPESSTEDADRDVLKLCQEVLSEMWSKDHTKRKVELLLSKFDRLKDLPSRVEKLEEKVRGLEGGGPGDVSPGNMRDPTRCDASSGGASKASRDKSLEPEVMHVQDNGSPGNCRTLLADLNSKVKRYEHFLQKVAATLREHGKQIEELQACNIVHGELIEGQSTQLSVLDTELGIHSTKLRKLRVDCQWQQFKVESLENSTHSLKRKVSQMDMALEGLSVYNGGLYGKLDPLRVNSSHCGNDCGKPSTLETSKSPQEEGIQRIESQEATGRVHAQSTLRSSSPGTSSHNTLKTLMDINSMQKELQENFGALKQTVRMLSLDVSSNRAELGRIDGETQLLYHQVDKLRSSDIKGQRHERCLRKRLRDLRQDVNHLYTVSGDRLLLRDVRLTSKHVDPFPKISIPLPGETEVRPVGRGTTKSSTTYRSNSQKREVSKYYIMPPSPIAMTEGQNAEVSPAKDHPFFSSGSSDQSAMAVVENNSEVRHTGVPNEDNKGKVAVVQRVHTPPHTNSCSLHRVGPPIIVHRLPKTASGWWRRDTWPGNHDSVYLFLDTYKANQLYEYPSLAHLQNGTGGIVYHLPFSCSGSGHIVHHRNLICNQFTTNQLMKYDLLTKEVRSRRLPDSGFHNSYPYTSGGLSDMDFAFDEVGMWVVYGSRRGKGSMVIAKLNPETLRVERRWNTPFLKTAVGNTFIICGKMYVVEYGKKGGTVTSVYNMETGSALNLVERPKVGSKRGALRTMLDYNPSDSMLYAWHTSWDWNGQLVTYKVITKDL